MNKYGNVADLRLAIQNRLGEYRAKHVLSTEEEAVRLAEIYLPEKIEEVRISALLHDITKEYDLKKQLQIFDKFGIIIDNVLLNLPKTMHALTAALIIPEEFPEYASEEIISAVKKHTTGHAEMELLDIIIYLADYIEPLRKFDDCKCLRGYFWQGISKCFSFDEKLLHLYRTMVLSFDLTISNLLEEKSVIASDAFEARNEFILKCLSISEGNN